MNTGWMECCCFVIIRHWFLNVLLKRKDLSQQNVNKTSVTQRRRPKKENNSSCSFYKTIKCNNNVNDSNKNVTNFFTQTSLTVILTSFYCEVEKRSYYKLPSFFETVSSESELSEDAEESSIS